MAMKRMVSALAALAVGVGLVTGAQAQVKIGVVTSSTGPVALVGIPQKNSIELLPTKMGA